MTNHTPGPWTASRDMNIYEVFPDTAESSPSIAFVVCRPTVGYEKFNAEQFAENLANTEVCDWPEAQANLDLILGAPTMAARIAQLEAALRAVEWGSCDGCGQKEYCSVCRERREDWRDENFDDPDWGPKPGKHKVDCPIGQALAKEET